MCTPNPNWGSIKPSFYPTIISKAQRLERESWQDCWHVPLGSLTHPRQWSGRHPEAGRVPGAQVSFKKVNLSIWVKSPNNQQPPARGYPAATTLGRLSGELQIKQLFKHTKRYLKIIISGQKKQNRASTASLKGKKHHCWDWSCETLASYRSEKEKKCKES